MTYEDAIALIEANGETVKSYSERSLKMMCSDHGLGDLMEDFASAVENDDREVLAKLIPRLREKVGQKEMELFYAYSSIR